MNPEFGASVRVVDVAGLYPGVVVGLADWGPVCWVAHNTAGTTISGRPHSESPKRRTGIAWGFAGGEGLKVGDPVVLLGVLGPDGERDFGAPLVLFTPDIFIRSYTPAPSTATAGIYHLHGEDDGDEVFADGPHPVPPHNCPPVELPHGMPYDPNLPAWIYRGRAPKPDSPVTDHRFSLPVDLLPAGTGLPGGIGDGVPGSDE